MNYLYSILFVVLGVFIAIPPARYVMITLSDWWNDKQKSTKSKKKQHTSIKEIDNTLMPADEFIEIL